MYYSGALRQACFFLFFLQLFSASWANGPIIAQQLKEIFQTLEQHPISEDQNRWIQEKTGRKPLRIFLDETFDFEKLSQVLEHTFGTQFTLSAPTFIPEKIEIQLSGQVVDPSKILDKFALVLDHLFRKNQVFAMQWALVPKISIHYEKSHPTELATFSGNPTDSEHSSVLQVGTPSIDASGMPLDHSALKRDLHQRLATLAILIPRFATQVSLKFFITDETLSFLHKRIQERAHTHLFAPKPQLLFFYAQTPQLSGLRCKTPPKAPNLYNCAK